MKRIRSLTRLALLLFSLLTLFTACARVPPVAPPPHTPPPPAPQPVRPLEPVTWDEVDGWLEDDPIAAFEAFVKSCKVLKRRDGWKEVCSDAAALSEPGSAGVRAFFEARFIPHRVNNADGSDSGKITGYYVPDLRGSRSRTEEYRYPLYGVPDDLLIIDLRELYPELGNYRLRGRVKGRRVVPYYSRGEIDGSHNPLDGSELFWVADPVELFFLHIQGSGRILLDSGENVMVHYADQNGHPYRSIGKLLLDRGEMTRDQMSMQNIKLWAENNPVLGGELLAENPSYVFFSALSSKYHSPPGALGIPLTPGRSIAVDPRTVPLGAPVFLSTTWPSSPVPLNRLMVAQDTGGAIKGAVRADFFWGMGSLAGGYAGKMKEQGRLWVFLPHELSSLQSQVSAK